MASPTKSDIVRSMFAAYRSKDRLAVERVFADDFRFTSPYDDAIDKTACFERCWPGTNSSEPMSSSESSNRAMRRS